MEKLLFGVTYFLIYGFLGWIVEVIYHATVAGKIVNRGFLNGPICPIYGVGMTGMILLLSGLFTQYSSPDQINVVILYLIGMVLCSCVELFGGWLLDRIFHIRWWDYSKEPYNIGGYICLRFSLLWGLGVVFALKFLHPLIQKITGFYLSFLFGKIGLLLCYILFVWDLAITVMTLVGLNQKMAEIEKAREDMRKVSDELTVRIADGAIKSQMRVEETREKINDVKQVLKENSMALAEEKRTEWNNRKAETDARIEELYNKYLSRRHSITNRLMRAYPKMRFIRHEDVWKMLVSRKIGQLEETHEESN